MKKVHVKLLISIFTAVVIISGTTLLVISVKFHHEQTKGAKNATITRGVLTVLKEYHQDFHCSQWDSLMHGKHKCGQNKPKFDYWEDLSESICLKYSLASTYTILSLVGICFPVIIQILVSLWAALPIFDRHFRDQECILSIWISRGLEGFLHLMGIHILVALMLFKYHGEELDWRDEMKREVDEVVDINCKEKEITLSLLVLCQRINIIVVLVTLVILLITGLWAEQDGPDNKVISHQNESEGVLGECECDHPIKSQLTSVEKLLSSQNDIKKEESASMTINFNRDDHQILEELMELDDEAENNLGGTFAPDDENSVAEVQGPSMSSAVPSGRGVQDDDSGSSSSRLNANKTALGLAVIHGQLANSNPKPSPKPRETSSKSNAMRSNINSSKSSNSTGNKSVHNRKGNSRNAPGMTGFSRAGFRK